MMPDKRLIDANALLDFISDERKEAADNKNHEKMRGNDYEMHFWSGALAQARWIRQHIKETPTIDAVEVVHGRWEKVQVWKDSPQTTLRCSLCKTNQPIYEHEEWKFCPFCGQPMDGGAE